VGVATSGSPTGPFADQGPLDTPVPSTDQSGRPVGCGDDAGYSNIDPAPFVDTGGSAYLYVSTDRACATPQPHGTCPLAPTISVIPLTSDLLHAAGPRQALFSGGQSWEQSGSTFVVENPWMRKDGSAYHLLYSGGSYKEHYGMGYATGSSPTGPFAKSPDNPILGDGPGAVSAGGGMAVTGPHGGTWLVYHARAGAFPEPRTLRIDPVRVTSGGGLAVDGPTTSAQTATP
jgi:beta-xylosidase